MKKFDTLQKELQMINNKKKENISIETLSLYDFIVIKMNSIKEDRIRKKLKKLDIAKRETILNCSIKLKYWFNNQNISCRKYCKIEERELYKKNKMLYKLGYLNQKPIHPFLQNKNLKSLLKFKHLIPNKIKSIFDFPNPKKIINKKMDTLSISTAKLIIKGVRKLNPSAKYLCKQIYSLDFIQYAKMVSQIAKQELSSASQNPIQVYSTSIDTKPEKSFRDSIRYIPSEDFCSPSRMITQKKIEHTKGNPRASFEYTL